MNTLSVIICTYNRSENLKELLECLSKQEKTEGSGSFEVIVVDNNSHDHTKEAVESYVLRFTGQLHYLFEPRQGKSFALNKGIKEAKGDILAFVDDDCVVGKDYIFQVNKVFQEYGPKIDFMGGRILPHWEGGNCPSWLAEVLLDQTEYEKNTEQYWRRIFFRGPLAVLDYGKEPFRVDMTQKLYKSFLFYGPNMAIRKSAFGKIGGYDPQRPITQDTEMCLRLIRAGMKGLYASNVKVYHRINALKLTPEFYSRWYFQRGKYLEPNDTYQRKFYHPLGVQYEFILKTCKLFLLSISAQQTLDKVYYRCQSLFNLVQILRIARKNIS